MNDFERVLETFRDKLKDILSDNNEWRRRRLEFACKFAIETIENMDIKETCKFKAWDANSWISSCNMYLANDIFHDHPKEWMKYCPKCGKLTDIETYTEEE